MSMKKTITKKAIAKTIAFLLIFVLIYMFIASFLRMTDVVNIATIDGFYKEPENTNFPFNEYWYHCINY